MRASKNSAWQRLQKDREAIGNRHGSDVAIADGAARSGVAAYSFRLALAALGEAHRDVPRFPSGLRVNSRGADAAKSAWPSP